MTKQTRSISVITSEIISDMQREYREAKAKHIETGKGKMPRLPHDKYYYFYEGNLQSMQSIDKITDTYICDSGHMVVAYALGNLSTWRGEKAKAIKKELNGMLK